MTDHSWVGTQVMHADGRKGRIVKANGAMTFLDLTIAIDGCRDTELVKLNAIGGDSGAKGWAWYCPEFMGNGAYLPLGDHNDLPLKPILLEDAREKHS